MCFQWIGASNQQFIQMFNDARPKAFTSINSIIKVEENLKRIAEKFRTADASYDGNLEEGAMCGKLNSEKMMDFYVTRFGMVSRKLMRILVK